MQRKKYFIIQNFESICFCNPLGTYISNSILLYDSIVFLNGNIEYRVNEIEIKNISRVHLRRIEYLYTQQIKFYIKCDFNYYKYFSLRSILILDCNMNMDIIVHTDLIEDIRNFIHDVS